MASSSQNQSANIDINVSTGDSAVKAQEVTKSLENLSKATGPAATGVSNTSKSLVDLGKNAGDTQQKTAVLVSDVGEMTKGLERAVGVVRVVGDSFRGLNPTLDATIDRLGKTAEGAAKFAKFGETFGPEGAIIGAAIGAILPNLDLLGKALGDDESDLEKIESRAHSFAEELRTHATPALTEYISQLRQQVIAQTQQQDLERRLVAGQATLLEYQATNTRAQDELARAQRQVNQLDQEALDLAGRRDLSDEQATQNIQALNRTTTALAEARTSLANATANATQAQDLLTQAQRREGTHTGTIIDETGGIDSAAMQARRDRQRQQGAAAADALRRQLEAEARARLESEMNDWAEEEAEFGLHGRRVLAEQERQAQYRQAVQRNNAEIEHLFRLQEMQRAEELQRNANNSYRTALAEQKRILLQHVAEQKQILQQAGQLISSVGQQFADGIGASVVAAIEGQKSFGAAMKDMARASLESLTQQAVGKAIWETALAAADFAAYLGSFGTAAPLLASSGAHLAAAGEFALIGGGAAIGLAAMGSGGGGSSSSPPSQQAAHNTSGTGGSSSQQSSGGPTSIIINVNTPALATHAAIGRAVQVGMEAYSRSQR